MLPYVSDFSDQAGFCYSQLLLQFGTLGYYYSLVHLTTIIVYNFFAFVEEATENVCTERTLYVLIFKSTDFGATGDSKRTWCTKLGQV